MVGFVDFFKTFKKENQERATPKEAPSHWIKCPSCNALMYYKEVIAQYYTCPKCNFHMRIGLQDRIALMCDDGSFVEYDKECAAEKLRKREFYGSDKLANTLLDPKERHF